MYTYTAYGLGIHTNIPLPEFLEAAPQRCDVHICVKTHCGKLEIPAGKLTDFTIGRDESKLLIRHVGRFTVRGGQEILVDSLPEANLRTIQLYLAEAIMTVLLYQRSLFVLHGSAVAVNGNAVVFLGDSGRGKSSVAAALSLRGHPIMTDDVAAIGFKPSVVVFPGVPQLKLGLEVATALGLDTQTMPQVHPHEEKYIYRNPAGFSHVPLPLKAIYIVEDSRDDSPALSAIPPQESLVLLIRHSYGARTLEKGRDHESYFRQAVQIAADIQPRYLHRPARLAQLPDLAKFIEDSLVNKGVRI